MPTDVFQPEQDLTGNTSLAASQRVETFIRALSDFELHGKLDELVQLFSDDCELEYKPREELYRGTDGARQFWGGYRGLFQTMHSLFTHIFETGSTVALEWYSDVKLASERDVRFSGVTILEFGLDERVKRFRTYYDTAALRNHRDPQVH